MIRPGSSVSRQKKRTAGAAAQQGSGFARGKKQEASKPDLQDFLRNCDYVGANTLLSFERKSREERPHLLMWLAYSYFHNGDYQQALETYDLAMAKESDPHIHAYKACCFYALCQYSEAETAASQAPESLLKTRILLHTAHKRNDETAMMAHHQSLTEATEDRLCLAGLQCLRSHWQEASEIYKRMLTDEPDYGALHVYIAFCYYNLDDYDVALEILQTYLSNYPSSITAVNLKACNHYQLYNGKAAEAELRVLQQASNRGNIFQEHDLLQHNLVVFRNGENALQVLPPLLNIIPEARINLVIYYLRSDDSLEAYNLIKDLEPASPKEYVLKGAVLAAYGQSTASREHIDLAKQLFQLVGASATEADTIPGRQCMASCFFLLRQFDDVLVYLKSIKPYFRNDDDFNWNYGISCAATADYKEGLEALLQIQNEKYRTDFCYLSWMTRCYVMTNEPAFAWEMYIRMEACSDSLHLLHLLANDCYRMGHFYYACKAFDVLERHDPEPEFWEGKRGAAIGVFQQVMAGKEGADHLQEVVDLLRSTPSPQVDFMINRFMKTWAAENHVRLE